MKIWKQGIIGILAIMVLAFAFAACDDGGGKKDDGVTIQPSQSLGSGTSIMIEDTGVGKEAFDRQVALLQEVYGSSDHLFVKVTKIRIVPGSAANFAEGVLSVGANADGATLVGCLLAIS